MNKDKLPTILTVLVIALIVGLMIMGLYIASQAGKSN